LHANWHRCLNANSQKHFAGCGKNTLLSHQRIVHKGGNITALISSIAWLSSRGAIDVNTDPEALIVAATGRKLSTDDRGLVAVAMALLKQVYQAAQTRAVTLHTTVSRHSFGRSSQTFLEVRHPPDLPSWTVYDLDNDVQPLLHGKPCSAAALSTALQAPGQAAALSMRLLAGDTQQDNTGLMALDGNRVAPLEEPRPLARPWIEEMIRANITRWYLALDGHQLS
jgi:hypothetical protein